MLTLLNYYLSNALYFEKPVPNENKSKKKYKTLFINIKVKFENYSIMGLNRELLLDLL